jgi:hypothetical protein
MATKYDRQLRRLEEAGGGLRVEICPYALNDTSEPRMAWVAAARARGAVVIFKDGANL